MNLIAFLKELSAQGAVLWVEAEKLRYRAPKDVLTPARFTEIKQHKAEILQLLHEDTEIFSHIHPLSHGQRALWFLYKLAPESAAYHIANALRIRTPIDVLVLKQAFQALIVRHPMLRTTFTVQNGEPVQNIHSYQALSFEETDAAKWPWETLNQQVVEAYQRPFNLETGPVLRVNLFRRSQQDYILLLTIHHIVFDGWSGWRLLVNELPLFYQAAQRGSTAQLPPLKWQYVDYVQWHADMLAGTEGERLWTYWQKQLAGELPILNLPTDRPRPPVQTYHGATHSVPLTPELTQRLKHLAQTEAVSLYMVLLAAFQILLHRYTGQDDILVGSPIAGRNQAEFADILGYFVNPVVLRADLSDNPIFKVFLSQVRQTVLEALAHQDYPFALLVEKLLPDRDTSRSPLFQVNFILQKQSFGEFKAVPTHNTGHAESTDFESFEIARQDSEFDLILEMVEVKNSLVGVFKYNTDLFDATTIIRMEKHFQTLLEGIVVLPEQHIDELPLLTKAEQHQLLIEWNDTATAAYPTYQCVHQLFETQVEKTPEAVAVVFEGQQLTYRELNIRANQLAHHLQALGVKPEVFVAICVERSLEMVYGLLAILKAGGAYVPLDPSYPIERLAFMLEDAQVLVLLTQQKLMAQLPTQKTPQVLCLDENWRIISKASTDNPVSRVQSNNLAYVIYTSGSTGKPKGTLILHQGLTNYLSWSTKTYQVAEGKGSAVHSSIGFDATITSLFSPLLVGQKVVLLAEVQEIEALCYTIKTENVSLIKITPAHLEILHQLLPVNEMEESTLTVIIGGEALFGEQLSFWRTHVPHMRLINEYGPTETVVGCCVYEVSTQTSSSGTIPIGRPIANTQLYILDKHGHPVPIGVHGELYIGGAGLARAYLNRPELTAEKFIPNPFGEISSRLYKTGDLARYLPDGNIEFLDRIDNQVKIRGFRIELGEIETVLLQHPAVREAVITCSTISNEEKNKRLMAYVVPNLDQPSQIADDATQTGQTELINQWQDVFEENYGQPNTVAELSFNISGWNSSYTGLPIPQEEMREWVDAAVNSILSLKPKRVLEIGCGTGLLLSRIAPHCQQYWGTDFSPVVLQQVEQIKHQIKALAHVKLFQRQADDFNDIAPGTFDTLILNSVVQYFPSIDYLIKVLDQAIQVVQPGGAIFLGDIRSLPLLKAYHASVQGHQAPDSLTQSALRQQVQQRLAQEVELVIDPAFFIALKQHYPQITTVQIQLKRGRYHNELTRFRYEVILQVGSSSPTVEIPWQDWQNQPFTLDSILQRLQGNSETAEASRETLQAERQFHSTQGQSFGVRGVPNARLETEIKTLEWLANAVPTETVGQLQETLSKHQPICIDPEDLWQLTDDSPYEVIITWSDTIGCYDVLFRHHHDPLAITPYPISPEPFKKPWHQYANHPLQRKLNRKWVPQLRQFLQDQLPDYMVPSAFVVLEAIPLTPNGKIDRRALLALKTFQGCSQENYVAPRTSTEETLASIWMDVLGLERVGIHDNFFVLGGHSLLAVQLISRVRDTFSIELPLQYLFESPTVAGLTKHIETIHKIIHPKRQAVSTHLSSDRETIEL